MKFNRTKKGARKRKRNKIIKAMKNKNYNIDPEININTILNLQEQNKLEIKNKIIQAKNKCKKEVDFTYLENSLK